MRFKSNLALLALSGSYLNAAVLVDDFSGGLASWSSTVILDAQNPGSNVFAFQVDVADGLEINTSSYDGIEQVAFIRSGATLNVGEEVQVDITIPLSSARNLGIYVGGTDPMVGVRDDYISVYGSNNTTVATRGFDGTTEYSNLQTNGTGTETLFVARTDVNTFEVGFYAGGVRNLITTRTPSVANSAEFVGIYADVRGAGVIGSISEFRIIPEPSTALLGALGLLSLVRRRRTK